MKIKYVLLGLLLGLCMPWSAKAQDTIQASLVVNDGTTPSSSIPFGSEYVAYGTHSQFIIPFESLTDMRGGTVSKMTFYCNQNGNWGTARFSVYVAEVSENVFTNHNYANWDWASMSQVYTGSLYATGDHAMEIVLDSAFTYSGGNLKIGFKEIQSGSWIQNLVWKGVKYANKNVAVLYRCDRFGWMYDAFANFLPKIKFDYTLLNLPAVVVTQGDITSNSASLLWDTPSPDVTGYEYQYNRASESFTDNWLELPSTATSVTLENLDPITEYAFRVKALYGEYESAMTDIFFKTGCPDYVTIPYYENFDSYVVEDLLKPSVRTLPDCWDYVNTSTNSDDNRFPTIFRRSIVPQYIHSQPNALQFYIDKHIASYEAKPQYAILPAMHNIHSLRVKFYARLYNDYSFSSKLRVGVMEGTVENPEFVLVQEIEPTNDYQLFTIDLDEYEGDGEHIAIWMEVPNSLYGRVFVDDLVVEELPMFTKPIASHGGMANRGWYLISSPLADTTDATEVTHLVSANAINFDLYRFNPNNVVNGHALIWENWKQEGDHYHFDLEPGRGYLYANADNVTLDFTGTPYNGNGNVTLQYDADVNLGGWNLVGNPFPVSAYIGDRYYLRMNNEGSGFVPATTGSPVGAMEGVFVYTETDGEVLTFSTTPPTRNSEQLSANVSKITRSGLTAAIDRAILRFDEGNELPKFQLNEESAKVYIPHNGLDYAVVAAEGQGEMPLNFRADENGTYTLSFSIDNMEFCYLHLFDNKTGVDVDLLAPEPVEGPVSYTFDATTTDYESRFKLVYATGSSVAGDSFTFINSNGNFSIFGIEGEATLQVLDVMGRMLSTETFSGSIEKQLNVAPGVYFIRLINGDDVKTQKIIVR